MQGVPILLIFAVAVELLLDVVYLLRNIEGGWAIEGSVARIAVMGTLGGIATFRRATWARVAFAACVAVGGIALLVASFGAIPGIMKPRQPSFDVDLLGGAVMYLLLALAAVVGGWRPRPPRRLSDVGAGPENNEVHLTRSAG